MFSKQLFLFEYEDMHNF